MTLGFLLDGLVALLLVATIVCCFVLNRRLMTLRNAHSDMKDVAAGLSQAMERAQAGVARLRSTAEEAGSEVDLRLVQARAISAELAVLTKTGRQLAEGLDAGLAGAGAKSVGAGVAILAELPRRGGHEERPALQLEAERELLGALRRGK